MSDNNPLFQSQWRFLRGSYALMPYQVVKVRPFQSQWRFLRGSYSRSRDLHDPFCVFNRSGESSGDLKSFLLLSLFSLSNPSDFDRGRADFYSERNARADSPFGTRTPGDRHAMTMTSLAAQPTASSPSGPNVTRVTLGSAGGVRTSRE